MTNLSPDPDRHESEPSVREMPFTLTNLPRLAGMALIRFYQLTISRALPPDSCRFYPTCSHYAYQAIAKYGLLRGGVMGAWRLLRCQPFNPGGYDPVP
jgi:putative membrane protein insertion efficiency factor